MKKLFKTLCEELRQGRGVVLCGILRSDGSAPRGAGAKMLVLEDGRALGTIGGGAVELHAQGLAKKLLTTRQSMIQDYRLAPGGGTVDLGMICGGNVDVGFQYFDPGVSDHLALAERVLALMDEGRGAWLITEFHGSGWQAGTYDHRDGLWGLDGTDPKALEPLFQDRGVFLPGDDPRYSEPLGRSGVVYIFGAGHVGRALTAVLSIADFQVVVYDQRPEVATAQALPSASAILCGPYTEALDRLPQICPEDCVVVMTPGHQADYEVLRRVLTTEAGYIGCIGSRRKVAATRAKLLGDGFTEEQIDRIYSPIGLDIGGETPGEIAVSVAAQIIAHRCGRLKGRELL